MSGLAQGKASVIGGAHDYSLKAQAQAQAQAQALLHTPPPEDPDLLRIARTIDAIFDNFAAGVTSMDATLERLGRSRVLSDGTSCAPVRCGLIGNIEDKLDRLASLVSDAGEIASQLNRIA